MIIDINNRQRYLQRYRQKLLLITSWIKTINAQNQHAITKFHKNVLNGIAKICKKLASEQIDEVLL